MSSRPAMRDSRIYRSSITSCVGAVDVPQRTGWAYLSSLPCSVLCSLDPHFSSHHCVIWLLKKASSRLIVSRCYHDLSYQALSCSPHVLSLFLFLSVLLNPWKRLSVSPSPVSLRCPGEPVLGTSCHLWSLLRWQDRVKTKASDGMR